MPRRRISRTNAEKQRAYRRRKKGVAVILRSTGEEWETPLELFQALESEFHFETDLAALPHNARCSHFYPPATDAQKQEWQGICWLNPLTAVSFTGGCRKPGKAHSKARLLYALCLREPTLDGGMILYCLLPKSATCAAGSNSAARPIALPFHRR